MDAKPAKLEQLQKDTKAELKQAELELAETGKRLKSAELQLKEREADKDKVDSYLELEKKLTESRASSPSRNLGALVKGKIAAKKKAREVLKRMNESDRHFDGKPNNSVRIFRTETVEALSRHLEKMIKKHREGAIAQAEKKREEAQEIRDQHEARLKAVEKWLKSARENQGLLESLKNDSAKENTDRDNELNQFKDKVIRIQEPQTIQEMLNKLKKQKKRTNSRCLEMREKILKELQGIRLNSTNQRALKMYRNYLLKTFGAAVDAQTRIFNEAEKDRRDSMRIELEKRLKTLNVHANQPGKIKCHRGSVSVRVKGVTHDEKLIEGEDLKDLILRDLAKGIREKGATATEVEKSIAKQWEQRALFKALGDIAKIVGLEPLRSMLNKKATDLIKNLTGYDIDPTKFKEWYDRMTRFVSDPTDTDGLEVFEANTEINSARFTTTVIINEKTGMYFVTASYTPTGNTSTSMFNSKVPDKNDAKGEKNSYIYIGTIKR